MKKRLTKITTMLLLIICCMLTFGVKCEAADGIMQISDASGAVGDVVNVTIKVDAGGDELGDCEATLSYDSEILEFVEGENAEETDTGIKIAQYGTGTETEFTFELQFRIIEEGKTVLSLVDSTAYLYSDETLSLQATGGAISSEKMVVGEPVDIGGTTYYFYEDFTEALILDGFSKSTLDYNGYTHNVIVQDLTGITAAYFVKEDNNPTLMIYDDSSASFIPAKFVSVSNDYYLILMEKGDGSRLSSDFAETTLEIDGTIFTTWQNMKETDYFLVYALSSEGFEGFYQYDSKEDTYQRYISVGSGEEKKENPTDDGIFGKLKELVDTYFIYVFAGIFALILIFIIIIMIMSSIIGKRNVEIEDLYEELEGSTDTHNKSVVNDFDEDFDDDFDYEDDFDDLDDFDDEDFEDEDEYDDFEDDYDEELDYEEEPKVVQKKKSIVKRKKVSKDTEDYSVDFIDL